MEITKREVIVSILIVSIMMIIGLMLSGKVSDSIIDINDVYNKAIHIEDSELFKYGMRTNIGHAFVYGDLVAKDVVGYDEIVGEYLYVEKVKEEYTPHTRVVSYPCGKSTCTRTETYWTWDRVGSESKKSKKVDFLGVEFDFGQFSKPSENYITTIESSSDVRYKYYGVPSKLTGTIFANLKDNNIGDHVKIYQNKMTVEAYDYVVASDGLVYGFWIIWAILTGLLVYLFCYLENDWLY